MLEFIEMYGITVTAITAVAVLILKIAVGERRESQRRKHLIRALETNFKYAKKELKENQERTDFEELECKIKSEEGFTPYGVIQLTGVTLRDIRQEYGFLDSDTLDKAVGYIFSENYLLSLLEAMRTEYFRGLLPTRKITLLNEVRKTLSDTLELSEKACHALEKLTTKKRMRAVHVSLKKSRS